MTIGEPPSEPLLAPRATCTIPRSRDESRTESSCGIALWRATIEQDPRVWTVRGRPHWLTYMASLFRCQGAAARHTPATGRAPHVDRFAAPTPPPHPHPRGGWRGQVTEARP
jgi:hypothetical protein